ncbi:hypothetical protein [Thermococcus sp.]|uniref:hypothetical protein n=1 Tax=Thermococcus sp. TaxID=35749 RepID=UPI00262F421D|nr:hypothetical protein [Thermococcus sp.]
MIGVISLIIAALMLKAYTLLLAPLVYLVSLKSRDLGVVAYILFALYTAGKLDVLDLYSYSSILTLLTYSLPMLLLLDDCLTRKTLTKTELVPLPFLLLGPALPEAFLAGLFMYFAVSLRPGRGMLAALLVMVIGLWFGRGYLDVLGGTSSQVLVIAAFVLFLSVLTLSQGNLKKVDMFKSE